MQYTINAFTSKLDAVGSGGGSGVVATLTGNSGVATASAGNINTLGSGSLTTTGSGDTMTFALTGLTNHSLLVGAGTATITKLGVASNGQIPIGSAAADPVLATITAGAGISVTNGAGSITIANTGSQIASAYTAVTNAASPYTVLTTDYYLSCNVTSGVITILLPNAPTTSRIFIIKDKVGLSATSNITVTTVGGAVTIDGSTSYVMATNYSAISLIFNGTSYEVF